MFLLISIDWEQIFAKGITPLIVLLIIGFILYKGAWPYVKQYLDDARNDRIEAQRLLKSRAENLEKREETQLASFTMALEGLKDALEVSGRRQESQISMMEETLRLVKDTNDITRRDRR